MIKMHTSKQTTILLITLLTVTTLAHATYDSGLTLDQIGKTAVGNTINLEISIINTREDTKIGEIKVGSPTTGYKTKEAVILGGEKETYKFEGFKMTEKEETFTLTMSHLGEDLLGPTEFQVNLKEVTPTKQTPLDATLSKGILILIGIIIITITGIILASPFIKREGAEPFEGDLRIDKIIKKD